MRAAFALASCIWTTWRATSTRSRSSGRGGGSRANRVNSVTMFAMRRDLVEHRARRLVEVRVELGILARAQASQRLDGRSDGRERVLDLVRDPPRHLAPRGDAARRREPPARGLEVDDHLVERLRELRDLAGTRGRSSGRASPLATFRASAASSAIGRPRLRASRIGEEQGDPGRREARVHRRPVDAREIVRELRLRLADDDGDARAGPVAQRAAAPALRPGHRLPEGHARVDRLAEAFDDGQEVPRARQAYREPARCRLAATREQRRLGRGRARVKCDTSPVDQGRDLGRVTD